MTQKIYIYFIKILITIILTLVILILVKASSNFKTSFYKAVYTTNISFAPLSNLYNKYIGNLDIFNNEFMETVFYEELVYSLKEDYNSRLILTPLGEEFQVLINDDNKYDVVVMDPPRSGSTVKIIMEILL